MSQWDGCQRFAHQTSVDPLTRSAVFKQGQRQAKVSLTYYHYLCAAIKGQFHIKDVPPDPSRAQLFERQGIFFDKYKEYPLEAVMGVKLHPRQDGTLHPGEVTFYVRCFRDNWKCREAGVLYFLEQEREFWNLILHYHSSAKTMGFKPWDRLFEKLKRSGFDKSLIPCMVCSKYIPREP